MDFLTVLFMIETIRTEPLDPRMAPRSIALEIARVTQNINEAAVMVEVAWEESRLIPNRIGDHGTSFCAFQLKKVPKYYTYDLRKCTETAYVRIQESARVCPDSPLSFYASGTCNARKLSLRRMNKAQHLVELWSYL